MSVYRVVIDGVDIYDPTKQELTLINPVLTVELGAAGNFEFTLPPKHIFYNKIVPFGSNILVYEDNQLIWTGRPLNPERNFWNQKRFHCEGTLAFLNDSLQGNEDITGTTVDYFRTFIARHNSQMQRADRQFIVRTVSHSFTPLSRTIQTNRETTFGAVKKYTIGVEGGYLFAMYDSSTGHNYLDWYDDMPYTCNQWVEFSLNMVSVKRTDDYDEICTGVYATGAKLDDGTIVNSGDIVWGDSSIRARYGDVVKKIEFPDINTQDDLITAAHEYLNKHGAPEYIIEAEAAELHFKEAQKQAFRVGQKVYCYSEPHLISSVFPLSRIVYYLDSGKKTITLGTLKRQTLTALQVKQENKLGEVPIPDAPQRENNSGVDEDIGSGIINPNGGVDPVKEFDGTWLPTEIDQNGNEVPKEPSYPYIRDNNGNDYKIDVDTSGSEPTLTLTKLFNRIAFSQVHSGSYDIGDTLNLSEFQITGYFNDGTSEVVPNSNCTFNLKNGYKFTGGIGESLLVAAHQRGGRGYIATTTLNINKGTVSAIHIAILPTKIDYYQGETIDFSGIAVEIHDENGGVYKDRRYRDGFIPFNELIFPVTVAGAGGTGVYYTYGGTRTQVCTQSDGSDGWIELPIGAKYCGIMEGTKLYIVAVYESPFTMESYKTSGEREDRNTGVSTEYQGQTYYVAIDSWNSPPPEPTIETSELEGDVKTMALGIMLGGGNKIPVEWICPYDNVTYTDYFYINIGQAPDPTPAPAPQPSPDPQPDPVAWQEDPFQPITVWPPGEFTP